MTQHCMEHHLEAELSYMSFREQSAQKAPEKWEDWGTQKWAVDLGPPFPSWLIFVGFGISTKISSD